jgi:hypothetical protein
MLFKILFTCFAVFALVGTALIGILWCPGPQHNPIGFWLLGIGLLFCAVGLVDAAWRSK